MVLEVSQTGIFGTLLAVLESLEVDSFLKKGDEKERPTTVIGLLSHVTYQTVHC